MLELEGDDSRRAGRVEIIDILLLTEDVRLTVTGGGGAGSGNSESDPATASSEPAELISTSYAG